MKILIVNDDGYRGKGLHALIRALKDEHDLTVVVPEYEQSGKSHSITFLDPLYLDKIYLPEADHDVYIVKGTPADCVVMGSLPAFLTPVRFPPLTKVPAVKFRPLLFLRDI